MRGGHGQAGQFVLVAARAAVERLYHGNLQQSLLWPAPGEEDAHRFVDVGMQLQSTLAKRLFYFLHTGAALHTEQVVRVTPRCRHQHHTPPPQLAAALPVLPRGRPVPGSLLLLPPAFSDRAAVVGDKVVRGAGRPPSKIAAARKHALTNTEPCSS